MAYHLTKRADAGRESCAALTQLGQLDPALRPLSREHCRLIDRVRRHDSLSTARAMDAAMILAGPSRQRAEREARRRVADEAESMAQVTDLTAVTVLVANRLIEDTGSEHRLAMTEEERVELARTLLTCQRRDTTDALIAFAACVQLRSVLIVPGVRTRDAVAPDAPASHRRSSEASDTAIIDTRRPLRLEGQTRCRS